MRHPVSVVKVYSLVMFCYYIVTTGVFKCFDVRLSLETACPLQPLKTGQTDLII
jgi:hypothetical protein